MIGLRTILSAIGGVLLLVAVSYVSVRVDRHLRPEPKVKTDTVRVNREVPRIVRDTVVKVKPETRVVYNTIRDTVTRTISVPEGFRMRGALPPDYFRVNDNMAQVTYFDTDSSNYVTDKFRLDLKDNKLSLGLSAFGTSRHLTTFPYLEYSTSRLELRAGYGPTVTRSGYYLTPSFQLSFDAVRYRW